MVDDKWLYKIRRISSLRGEREPFQGFDVSTPTPCRSNNWCSHKHNVNLTAARLCIEHNADI